MKSLIKNLTKKQLLTYGAVAAGVLVLVALAVLVSNLFKDTVSISVGEVKIYSREYNRLVKQAEQAGMSKEELTATLISYYKTKEAARQNGLTVSESYLEQSKETSKQAYPNLPDSILVMKTYDAAIASLLTYSEHKGVHGKMVALNYLADDNDYSAILSKDEAKRLIDNAYNELKNNKSESGIKAITEAYSSLEPEYKYMFTEDGKYLKADGELAYKTMPTSSKTLSEYLKNCTEDVCPVAEDAEFRSFFFIQKYFTVDKVETNMVEKFYSAMDKIKVVDYVN